MAQAAAGTVPGFFHNRPLAVHEELCLNRRFKAACSRCSSACPTGAIRTTQAAPTLAADQCVRCGACTVVCPTAAFTEANPPEQTLLATVAPVTGAIQITCGYRTASQAAPAAGTVIVHARCLAALAPGSLLAVSRAGERPVWLDDSGCAGCSLAANRDLLHASAAAANALLAAFGRPPALHLLSAGAQPGATPGRPAVIDGRQPLLSRRSFFGMFRQIAAGSAAPADHGAASQGGGDTAYLPEPRQHLLQQLRSLPLAGQAAMDTDLVPFAQVAIDAASCTACGLCSRFCPTGALQFSASAGAFALHFSAAACVDCGLCSLACPSHALAYAPALPAAAIVSSEPALVAQGTLAPCQACGTPVAAHSGRPDLCFVCAGAGTQDKAAARRRDRTDLFAQLAGGSSRRPQNAHHHGAAHNAQPSCLSEGVIA